MLIGVLCQAINRSVMCTYSQEAVYFNLPFSLVHWLQPRGHLQVVADNSREHEKNQILVDLKSSLEDAFEAAWD